MLAKEEDKVVISRAVLTPIVLLVLLLLLLLVMGGIVKFPIMILLLAGMMPINCILATATSILNRLQY